MSPSRQIRRKIVSLALPVVAGNLLERAVHITDIFLVGGLGVAAISAVGLSQLLIFLVLSLTNGLRIGTLVVIAQLTGARQHQKAREAAWLSLWATVALSVLTGMAGLFLRNVGVTWMGADSQVAHMATDYLFYHFLFFPFTLSVDLLTAILHGQKETRTPMKGLVLVNLIHFAAAYPLIYGIGVHEMGVGGAALAGGIAEGIGMVYLLREVTRKGYMKSTSFKLQKIWPIVQVGFPLSLDRILQQTGQMVYARMVMVYGTVAYAAHQVGLAIESFSFLAGNGFAIAAIASVGQSVGAARIKKARVESWEANKAAVGIMATMGLLFFFSPYLFLRPFTSDPEVITLGIQFLRVVALMQVPLAITMVLSGSLKGAGDTRYLLWVTLVGNWLVRIPLGFYIVYVQNWGIQALWGVMVLDWLIRMVMVLLRYRSGLWESSGIVEGRRP